MAALRAGMARRLRYRPAGWCLGAHGQGLKQNLTMKVKNNLGERAVSARAIRACKAGPALRGWRQLRVDSHQALHTRICAPTPRDAAQFCTMAFGPPCNKLGTRRPGSVT